jgi:hypothetical protein
VEHVLKGGQIPGIPRETLNHIVKQYMQRLYLAAAQAQGIPTKEMPISLPPNANISRILRPVSELPNGLVQSVIDGNPLPHLTTEQTRVIKVISFKALLFLNHICFYRNITHNMHQLAT